MEKELVHSGFIFVWKTERDHLEDLDVDGELILECILKK
jgi:hypothetical protein